MTNITVDKKEVEEIYELSSSHKFVVNGFTIYGEWEDCQEAGSIDLLNLCNGEIESYTIWTGDEDGTSFYICLPTGEVDGEEEDELEVYYLDAFDIHIAPFSQLPKSARFSAAIQLLDDNPTDLPITLLQAYRVLKKDETKHLYEQDTGILLSNEHQF